MDWGAVIQAAAPLILEQVVKGGMGGIAGTAAQKGQLEVTEEQNKGAMERQQASDAAEMERLLESLGVSREQIEAGKQEAAVAATSAMARQALANIPDAYKTMIEAILGGRAQEQGAFANLAASSQKAAMGR